MRKNRCVLYVGGFEMPDKNAAAHRVIGIGKVFNALGFNLLYNGFNKKINKDECRYSEVTIDGLKCFLKSNKYPSTFKEWLKYVTEIDSIVKSVEIETKRNVEIIIAYNYPAIKLWRLSRYCGKKNIKLISDSTEWEVRRGGFLVSKVKNFDNWLRMTKVNFKVSGLITISDFLSIYYKSMPNITIPPLVDLISSKWHNEKLNLINERRIITYFGSPRSASKDRLDLVIQTLAQIKLSTSEFFFQIIGITELEYLEKFRITSLPDNIKENLVFYGRKEHLEAIELLKRSDFSIFVRKSSRVNNAGFPTKFVESISLGIPVLTNETSDIKKYLINGKNGFILDVTTQQDFKRTLENALRIPSREVAIMKNFCKQFKEFDYNKYITPVGHFVDKLN